MWMYLRGGWVQLMVETQAKLDALGRRLGAEPEPEGSYFILKLGPQSILNLLACGISLSLIQVYPGGTDGRRAGCHHLIARNFASLLLRRPGPECKLRRRKMLW